MAPVELRLSVWWLIVCLLTAASLIAIGHAAIPPEMERNTVSKAVAKKVTANGSPPTPTVAEAESASAKQCREECLAKHSTKQSLCFQQRNCTTCQEKCAAQPSPTVENAHHLSLVLLEMIRNESLVTADVAWVSAIDRFSSSTYGQPQQHQCLVTWEVSGGGLMGNLLTESASAQLSLWPETNYRVQVTCRNKHTDALIRSTPIVLNTSEASVVGVRQLTTSITLPSVPLPELIEAGVDSEDAALVELQDLNANQETASVYSVRAQLAVWPISRESQQEVILLGVFVALLTFLLILLTVVIFIKRKAPSCSEKEAFGEDEGLAEILHV
ncbi:transmembrane protein fend-like [Topomyia yanbarensis]|uniref:transmembrane protein fend-like n=1 Tax=Topomyia yanbarensis TaxID=2498891 RepID=UPI00273C850F|nr:transmembrane protein fend-like [Topomyia yanbarensis]